LKLRNVLVGLKKKKGKPGKPTIAVARGGGVL